MVIFITEFNVIKLLFSKRKSVLKILAGKPPTFFILSQIIFACEVRWIFIFILNNQIILKAQNILQSFTCISCQKQNVRVIRNTIQNCCQILNDEIIWRLSITIYIFCTLMVLLLLKLLKFLKYYLNILFFSIYK